MGALVRTVWRQFAFLHFEKKKNLPKSQPRPINKLNLVDLTVVPEMDTQVKTLN